MPSVLFVCTANIRRSPMAEILFVDWLRRSGVSGRWAISSAGTWATEGLPAAPYACEAVKALGLDLSRHRARRVDGDLLAAADLVICMTHSQLEALRAEFPACAKRSELFRRLVGQPYDVADPEEATRQAHFHLLTELEQLIECAGYQIVARARNGNGLAP